MLSTGIKLSNLQSLTRRYDQLSYVAKQKYHFSEYKQTFSDKSIHDRKQFFAHVHEIVTFFKKSTQKLTLFT